jgi:hypothetical protein
MAPEGYSRPVATVSAAPATASSSSTPPTPTAPVTTAAPATASIAATMPSTATAATTAFALRARLVDYERPSQEVLAVQSRDRLFRRRIVAHLSETEAARLPGESIAKQRKRIRLHTNLRK